MRSIIKMPKEIESLEQFNNWIDSLNTTRTEIQIRMKRRTNFYPYDFIPLEDGLKVDYLISDSVSRGICMVKNFNKVFQFTFINYNN